MSLFNIQPLAFPHANKLRRIQTLNGCRSAGEVAGGIHEVFIFKHIGAFGQVTEKVLRRSILYSSVVNNSFFPTASGELANGFEVGCPVVFQDNEFQIPVGRNHHSRDDFVSLLDALQGCIYEIGRAHV